MVDSASFLSAYQQIFERELYRFNTSRENPKIVDCGANIGLCILYWKQLYPAAHITAFEPDPEVFETLVWNCKHWELTNVELINKAVWSSETELPFWAEGADAGRLLENSELNDKPSTTVMTANLRDYLQGEVDFLKLDIEGAETEVLLHCADRLRRISNVFVEYHSFVGKEQEIDAILRVLRHADFRIHIQPELVSQKPFVEQLNKEGMDQRLNIFAYRSHS
ncbi:MAG: FkbM family methyltransferase [Desulfobacterales bacterium]|nr:FkbM family methyltransferase [Desulfobacterales bacterium]